MFHVYKILIGFKIIALDVSAYEEIIM
jgi:hypothetical protein